MRNIKQYYQITRSYIQQISTKRADNTIYYKDFYISNKGQ